MKRTLALLLLLASPAEARHHHHHGGCGHGKILRVSMGLCVGSRSRLALEVLPVHHRHWLRRASLQAEEPRQEPQRAARGPKTDAPLPLPLKPVEAVLGLPEAFVHSVMMERPNYWRDRAAQPVRFP